MLNSRFSPNDILLTSTSLVQASRLASDVPAEPTSSQREPSNIQGLFEFCNVVESVVLNDRILVLDGLLPSDDEDSLEFVRSLMDSGIVETTVPDGLMESATKAAHEMLGSIGNDNVYGMALVNGGANIPSIPPDMVDVRQRAESQFPIHQLFDLGFRKSQSRGFGHVTDGKAWIDEIQNHLHKMVSPNTNYVIQQIRAVFYWSLAEQARLSFSPDLARANWLSKWLRELKKSLSQEIYREVAVAFLADAKELLEETRPTQLLLPPIPALLIDRASSKKTLILELLGLRDEFQPFRRSLLALEQEKRNAQSLKELGKVRSEMNALHAAITKKYKQPQPTIVEKAIGFAGDAAKVAIAPTKPDNYVAFGTKGLAWIREWWVSRPIFRLTSATDRLMTIRAYPQLAARLLGRQPTDSEVKSFSAEYREPLDSPSAQPD